MKKTINSIRDTFYDLNHFMWMLIIFILMTGIVGYQIHDLFSKDYKTSHQSKANTNNVVTKVSEEAPVNIDVTIPEGATYLDVSKILIDTGIIKDEEKFVDKLQKKGLEKSFVPGNYSLTQGMNEDELLKKITKK